MNQISLNELLGQISIGLDAVEAELVGAVKYHSKRVAALCLAVGREMGYDGERLFCLAGCALLHDNALTEYILSEHPDNLKKLNLNTHCMIGQENARFFPFPLNIDGMILYHHESADGKGAFGKRSGEYPEEAGIIALADQVDVRYSLRNCDSGKLDQIRMFLENNKGKKFDEKAVNTALSVIDAAFLKRLTDDSIFDTLKADFPEFQRELSNHELVRISGIIAKIIDYKSNFTQKHSTQIANKAWLMANYYEYDDTLRAEIYLAAALHDIGKLLIPSAILEKPGILTEKEFSVIQAHVTHTWDILRSIQGFERIAVWASSHHEKLNGTGYPFGKTSENMDFNSRLLACLDVYQAVSEKRPYHPARNHADTMKILKDMAAGGYIDRTITEDLDHVLSAIPDGIAAYPDELKY